MAISCTSSVIRAMPSPALRRIGIGVEPVWLSLPVSVTCSHQALAVGDDADVLALGLEDRPLLDVQLEEGLHLARADRLVALPADALELVAEASCPLASVRS
jgi:hypothetical protein